MAKKKLIWYPGSMYHLTSRGNRRSDLFKDEEDYLIYLDVVKEAIEYYNNSYEVIAYTLMTNHVHLQIKTKDNHIWQLMSRINKNYARNFNNKYNFVGHVFKARYNGEIIENYEYVESNLEIVYPMGLGLKQIIVNLMSSFREFYSCDLNHIFIHL